MKANVGGVDKTMRLILGAALLSLLFFGEGNMRWFGLIGIVPIFTALIGWCPAYAIFGISSCPAKKQ